MIPTNRTVLLLEVKMEIMRISYSIGNPHTVQYADLKMLMLSQL